MGVGFAVGIVYINDKEGVWIHSKLCLDQTLPDCLTIRTFPGALIVSMFACDAIEEFVESEGTGKYQSFTAR